MSLRVIAEPGCSPAIPGRLSISTSVVITAATDCFRRVFAICASPPDREATRAGENCHDAETGANQALISSFSDTVAFDWRWIWLAAWVVLVAAGCSESRMTQSPPADADESALAEFNQRMDAYVDLHKRAVGPLGGLDDTKTPAEITAWETALANAIRAARPQAKAGDLFAPRAAAVMKKLIGENYRQSPAVRDTRKDAEIELPDFTPVVNDAYPPTYPLGTFPPTLLMVLPPLPDVLEYRIVTHHLILRDVAANLIVDVLPNAVPQEKQ
jgi:hypothetical protein